MSWLATFILATAGALIADWMRKEADGRTPRLIARFVGWTVRGLPESRRDRLGEEWLASLQDMPSPISQVMFAANIWIAAHVIRWRDSKTLPGKLEIVAGAASGAAVLAISSSLAAPITRTRGLGWLLVGLAVAPTCYLVAWHGKATREQVVALEQRIIETKREIAVLEAGLERRRIAAAAATAR